MQLELFHDDNYNGDIALEDLFEAYFSCRKNKRKTADALSFEVDFEEKFIQLWREINDGTYTPGRSVAFIVNKPVKREIFAAAFRDRVVHHLIINKLNPLFEKSFIYDSCSCRIGKGTHFGIKRVDRFIKQCSENYTKNCYILKLDISGFFMHINRELLFYRLLPFILYNYRGGERNRIIEICRAVIYNDPTKWCVIKGARADWDDLPKRKSLFHSPENCGLPIGNLTSQVFANFYLNPFDHFIKHTLRLRYYSRYVDDFIIVHEDKQFLLELVPQLEAFLRFELGLLLHPRKRYVQHYRRGIAYLGAYIKPGRVYIGSRTKGNFKDSLMRHNEIVRCRPPCLGELQKFMSSVNSYLGIMRHYNTFLLRRKILLSDVSGWWWKYVYVSGGYRKVSLRAVQSASAM